MGLVDDLKAARTRARKAPSRKKTAKKTAKKRAKKTTKKTAKKRAKKTAKKTAKKRAKKTTKKTATKKYVRRPRGELLGTTGDLPWRIYREPKETDYHYNLRKSAMKMAMSHVKPAEVMAHPVKR